MNRLLIVVFSLLPLWSLAGNDFTFVELNCENLFDCVHDSLKDDWEFLPEGKNHWTRTRYWRKVNRIGQEIIACGEDTAGWHLPDLVALCEVENDLVMRDLTKRSLLRKARYEYLVTSSPDVRGIDVALLYNPFSFQLLHAQSIRIHPLKGMRPTRDILYARGLILSGDTLHIFVVHAPSRSGGERDTRPHRQLIAEQLRLAVDSVRTSSPSPHIIIAGDFNDYTGDASLKILKEASLCDVSENARGCHGAKGTYRYQGEWGSLDHIFCTMSMVAHLRGCRIFDAEFLLEEDTKYGGVKPRRNYLGPRYLNGFSDHLPLVAKFRF